MLVSAIVLNWNGALLIKECLDSVLNQSYSPLEIIVVDNGSTDNSIEIIKTYDIKLIVNEKNVGFAKAVNKGIDASKGEYVLPLNNDVVLDKEYVKHLVQHIAGRKDTGSASGKLLFAAAGSIIDSAGHSIHKNRLPRNIGTGKGDNTQFSKTREVFGVCGAAPLYKRKMLEDTAVNGEYFDESFFSFLEDVDLDWRARLRGWKSFFVPEAIARHHRGGTAVRRSRIVEEHNYKNRYLMIIKNDYAISFLKNFHQIIFTDVVKTGALLVRCPSALLGIFSVLKLLPQTLRKRRIIKKGRKVSRKEMEKWFLPFDYKAWFHQHLTTDVYDLSKFKDAK